MMSRSLIHVVDVDPRFCQDGRAVVRTSETTLYVIGEFRPAGSVFVGFKKSTNNGISWSNPVQVLSGTGVTAFACYYDRWTAGDAGTLIHIACIEAAGADDVQYRTLDISSDTLGTERTVFSGASTVTGSAMLSLCKARGGNLYIAFDLDGGTETGFYRSTDAGVTWGSRSNLNEGSGDLYSLHPGNYADNQDIDAIFWDTSADEISLKTYDDSGDAWSEASISTGMADVTRTTAAPQFSAQVRHSDGHLILVAWNSRDVSTADLKVWDINGAGSITAKTDVVTNADDCQCALLAITQGADTLVVVYLGKSDGSEVVGTSVGVYGKTSTDGGATWGAEFTLTDVLSTYFWLGGCPSWATFKLDVTMSASSTEQHLLIEHNRAGRGIGRGM